MRFRQFVQNSKSLIRLAYPILIGQLVLALMAFSDTVMTGHVSATDMAAVAIASNLWFPVIILAQGVIMGISPIISQHTGAKRYGEIANEFYQVVWIIVVFVLLLLLAKFTLVDYVQSIWQLDADLKPLVFDYLSYIMLAAPASCLFMALRNYTEALATSKPGMYISVLGLLLNLALNYVFIYGEFGFSAMGAVGCGLATFIVCWVMLISMLVYCYFASSLKKASLFESFYWPDLAKIKSTFKLGFPIAMSLLFEVCLYSLVAFLIIPFGALVVASHQVAMNFITIVFMIPLSVAMALTIIMGRELGAEQHQNVKGLAHDAILLGLLITGSTAILTFVFAQQIIKLYSIDPLVIELATSLIVLTAVYQFVDSIQAISAGALRAYKDTLSISYITFFSFWLVGLSTGVTLALTDLIVPRMGVDGFWIGFITGLSCAAILLFARLTIVQRAVFQRAVLVTQTEVD